MKKLFYAVSIVVGLIIGIGIWFYQYNTEVSAIPYGKPNIIFLSFCSMRAEDIGLISGSSSSVTPVIDRSFQKGFIFKNSYSSYGWTNMSSFLFENFNIQFLAAQGYEFIAPPASPLIFWVPTPLILNQNQSDLIEQYTNQYANDYSELKNLILNRHQNPFFIFVHTKYLHYPYIDTLNSNSGWSQYLSEVEKNYVNHQIENPEKSQLPFLMILTGVEPNTDHVLKLNHTSKIMRFFKQYKFLSDADLISAWKKTKNYELEAAIIHKIYRAKLNYLDHQLEDILNLYGDRRLQENTIIVLTGDHGESIMEHDILGHAAHIYDEIMRFPLLVKFPRSKLSEPIFINDQVFQGTFKDILKNMLTGKINENNFYKNVTEAESNQKILMRNCSNTIFGVRSENKWKYIKNYKTGETYLFDLAVDSAEKNNLKDIYPKQAAELELYVTLNRNKIGKINDYTPCQLNYDE